MCISSTVIPTTRDTRHFMVPKFSSSSFVGNFNVGSTNGCNQLQVKAWVPQFGEGCCLQSLWFASVVPLGRIFCSCPQITNIHQYNDFHPVIPRSLTSFVRIGLLLGCSQNWAANIGGFHSDAAFELRNVKSEQQLKFQSSILAMDTVIPQWISIRHESNCIQIMSNLCVLDSKARGCFSTGRDMAWYHHNVLVLVMHHVRWLNPGG